jgi:hypothetical protein
VAMGGFHVTGDMKSGRGQGIFLLQALAGEGARPTRRGKGKGQSDFSGWPSFMPATTGVYPELAEGLARLAWATSSAQRGFTSVFGIGPSRAVLGAFWDSRFLLSRFARASE